MTAHDLARHLLAGPDLPVATHANNHTFLSRAPGGELLLGILHTYVGDHVIIGNVSKRQINPPNWYITQMLVGDAPEEWR